MNRLDVDTAVRRAQQLAASPDARILGITGPPGAGKSTLAELVRDRVDGAVLVGMDGFHLAHSTLERLGAAAVKGAPATFDAAGYVALLRRVRPAGRETVWAPEFRREIEDAIAAAVEIPAGAPLVVTEGNYLLLPDEPWCEIRELADEIWYVEPPEETRHRWLAARHEHFGRTTAEAWDRTLGTDEVNARLVHTTRPRADHLITPT